MRDVLARGYGEGASVTAPSDAEETSAAHGVEALLLGVEDARRPAMQQALVPGGLDHTAAGGEGPAAGQRAPVGFGGLASGTTTSAPASPRPPSHLGERAPFLRFAESDGRSCG
jgi:hypothetical protein